MKPTVTLPSIQEMFPDHFLYRSLGVPAAHTDIRPLTAPKSKVPHTEANGANTRIHGVHQAAMPERPHNHPAIQPSRTPSQSSASENETTYTFSLPAPRHTRRVRDDERRHKCETCGKAFNRPSSLLIHMNVHSKERPFICPYPGCGRSFGVKSNMRRHLRKHTSPDAASSYYSCPFTTTPRPLPLQSPYSPGYNKYGAPSRGASPRARGMARFLSSSSDGSDEDDPSDTTATNSPFASHLKLEDVSEATGRDRLLVHFPSTTCSSYERKPVSGAYRY